MTFKAVIFDMDGTIIDSLTSYQIAFNRGVGKFGLPPAEIKPLTECLTLGMRLEEVVCKLYPEHDVDQAFFEACRQEMIAAFTALTENAGLLLPDTIDVLQELKARGVRMGIATGRTTQSARVRESIRKLGIDHFFDAVVTTADVPAGKPSPDSIFECARLLGIDTSECLVVGDAVADIQAGKSAGATVVAVTTGVSDEAKLAPHEPAKIYRKLSDILELF